MSSERLAAAVTALVDSVSDSFDTPLAETINGLYETELINPEIRGGSLTRSSWPPPSA